MIRARDAQDSRQVICKAASVGAIIAAVFCVIVGSIMLANYVQLKVSDPLNAPALVQLRQEFAKGSAGDSVKTQIRSLDLLARKAYFTSQRQLRFGGFLLLGGALAGVLLMLIADVIREKVPDMEGLKASDSFWRGLEQARWWVLGGSVAAVAVGVAAGLASSRELSMHWAFQSRAASTTESTVQTPAQSATGLPAASTTQAASWVDEGDQWPNFRGPGGNAHAVAKDVPVRWDGTTGENVKWKQTVPRAGVSSPVVWGKRVFLTGGTKEGREVFAFDAETGVLLWTTPVKDMAGLPGEMPSVNDSTGLAAPTPATDGDRVYAIFATGELICTDMDGKTIWRRFMGTPENHYGHASSLLSQGNLLYVQFDDSANPRLFALEAKTGKTVWEVKRQTIGWASPICVNTGKRKELILCDSLGVVSYEPQSGKVFWRQDCLGGEEAPSAAFAGGMVFAAQDNAKACGIRLGDAEATVAWEWSEMLPDTASPLATEKRVFLACSGGPMVCLSAGEGKEAWQKEFSRGFYASPVLAGGRVYAVDLAGVTHVFEDADEYTSVAENPLGEDVSATPAFANGRIFIRSAASLFCIGK